MGEYGPRRTGYIGACVDGPLFGRNLAAETTIVNVPVDQSPGFVDRLREAQRTGHGLPLAAVYRFDSALRVWHSQPLQPDREVPRGLKV